ncbi:MAG: ABC transporter ATP-binding protein [Sphaerochaeta sp.]|nr:ABC transporter ATP-binding protein [Sphaerochaeta sp.]MCH3919943.1 ABC transporter ATP-binding protein [Sphaerochaeta sp.]MCI2045590.1 ABC transporter ATP-binding protein [Sphaerochaeta sp.]MCI2097601.1 ABC transporter ATP-binding protein [Sphaerochaeta sp.]MCI2104034.1 ABC transporter ATP-binding protein [Sphaerochaeta sp.]
MAVAVEIQHVTKCFSKVIANKDVSLTVNDGEVLALLGENGAGKSTIMKILYGLYDKDEGRMLVHGREVRIKSPRDAMALGIAMIQQHFSLVPTHTATENIILGHVHGYLPLKKCSQQVQVIAQEYEVDVPLDVPVGKLSVGQQQKIEILKALYINARILIMDEPTAVLTPQESETLMRFIRSYVAKGNSAIFITHKMREVMEVADRITVMRSGMVVDTVRRSNTDEHSLARMMIGRDIQTQAAPQQKTGVAAPVVLSVEHLSLIGPKKERLLTDVSFQIHQGEVFGIAGVSGNGQDALCDVISGRLYPSSGLIRFEGKDISRDSVRSRNERGIGYVPLDRYRDGMVMEMSLAENLLLKGWRSDKWISHGFVRNNVVNADTQRMITQYHVKATGPDDTAKSLSGGNQQKVVLAREVAVGTHLLICNQPSRGLDMGAVEHIHQVIFQAKQEGKAVLLISTELSELFEMADQIAVMYQGEMVDIFPNGARSIEEIGLMMAGAKEKNHG